MFLSQFLINNYIPVIGLEVHAVLKIERKLFCSCLNRFGYPPNALTCPVCLGHPGTMPRLNEDAAKMAMIAGSALHCQLNEYSCFDRKHYFYPDMPKNYQITQYRRPFAQGGYLDCLWLDDGRLRAERVFLRRIHLEEDAGKHIIADNNFHHDSYEVQTGDGEYYKCGDYLVDFNRAGVPLLEIVSLPCLHEPKAASAYLKTLAALLKWLGVSDGKLEEGSFRCDANISLCPRELLKLASPPQKHAANGVNGVNCEQQDSSAGECPFGERSLAKPKNNIPDDVLAALPKIELKNLNSFKAVEQSLRFEIERQAKVLAEGGTIASETRSFDEKEAVTKPMRSKESVNEYRYMPEPDLPALHLPLKDFDRDVKSNNFASEKLPAELMLFYMREYGADFDTARLVAYDRGKAAFLEDVSSKEEALKMLVNCIAKFEESGIMLSDSHLTPEAFDKTAQMVKSGKVSHKNGEKILEKLFFTGGEPQNICDELNLGVIADSSLLAEIVKEVVAEEPELADKYLQGSEKAWRSLIGKAMKKLNGRADRNLLEHIFADYFSKI
ncbi:MAG: aspartyl/glutamyl-tRNA amidotransferase subunit B [bacterium]|nr:aspartyl/glutamyl-tRNA amidotransferase subunit B [bacterium]